MQYIYTHSPLGSLIASRVYLSVEQMGDTLNITEIYLFYFAPPCFAHIL